MISLEGSLLSAVNLCLAGIGREPVPELDTPDLDSAMALSIIEQVSLEIQANGGKGWWFNQESNWELQVAAGTGIVQVPNNTLSILEARSNLYDKGNHLTIRQGKVYDTKFHTFDLRHISETSITFYLVLLIPYEDLPVTAKNAIAWRSRRIFASDIVGDGAQDSREAMMEARAYQAMTSEHSRSTRRNALSDNPLTSARINMIAGTNNLRGFR